jgi:hypothetical protein
MFCQWLDDPYADEHTNTHTHTHTHMLCQEWLDDPYADEHVMARLLRHPRVSQQLTDPDIMDPPIMYQIE